jgi:putative GTP pyrophosphokinase
VVLKVWSNSQIDRLGERVRREVDSSAVRELDAYRRSFWDPYVVVGEQLRAALATQRSDAGPVQLSGRFGKSTYATVAKLRRLKVRLSQVQDIAGYRIIVPTATAQASATAVIVQGFENSRLYDRTSQPSHGYRAVHVVVEVHARQIEIQVRTVLQQLWGQLSERLSDTLRLPGIKYGEYPADYPAVAVVLATASDAIQEYERLELLGGSRLRHMRDALIERLDSSLATLER